MYIFINGAEISSLANYKFHQNSHWVYERSIQTHVCGYHLEFTNDVELVAKLTELEKVFIKATMQSFPNFRALHGPTIDSRKRAYGIYRYGKAKATLLPSKNSDDTGTYWLTVETTSWEGLADIKTLEEMIWAGEINPVILYDREQRRLHPLEVLKELLSARKLSWLQRFFIAMRLTLSKG